MKRSRSRSRRQTNPINRSYDSNGPDVRVRGTAAQIYEKYQSLARDATSAGDRVHAENCFQHAEHYYRILQSLQPQARDGDKDDKQNNEPINGENESIQNLNKNNGAPDAPDSFATNDYNQNDGDEDALWQANPQNPLAAEAAAGFAEATPDELPARRRGPLRRTRKPNATSPKATLVKTDESQFNS